MTGLLILLLIVLMAIVSRFTRFIDIFSGKLTICIIGIYMSFGVVAFSYLVFAKDQHIVAMEKSEVDELLLQNEQFYKLLNEGNITEIDASDVLATYVLETEYKELTYQLQEDAIPAFIQYRDDLDPNEIRVTTYKNFFNLNGYNMTDVDRNWNISIVGQTLSIIPSYKSLKVLNVTGHVSFLEHDSDESLDFYTTRGNPAVFLEVPTSITIHDENDTLIVVK